MLETVDLRDDQFRTFGGLRAGQAVAVLDEPVAGGGKWSDVAIARPIAIRGLVERRRLVVFARAEIEVQPGLAWLMAGAPLAIVSGSRDRVRVVVAHTLNEKSQLPAIEVPCALLRATPPPEIVGWDILGPLHRGRADRVAGSPVDWEGVRQLESDDGAKSLPLGGGERVYDGRRFASVVVKLEATRALVEIVNHSGWTRHRGWTRRDGLDLGRKKVLDVICGCAESAAWLIMTIPDKPRAKLAAPVTLRSAVDGRSIAILPAGDAVTALAVTGEQALVVWTGNGEGNRRPDPQQVLFGHVPTTAIAPLTAAAVNSIVEGSIKPGLHGLPLPRQMVVKAEWGHGHVKFHTEVSPAPDGSFRLISPVNRNSLPVWVERIDGGDLTRREYAHLQPGKTTRVDLTLDPDIARQTIPARP